MEITQDENGNRTLSWAWKYEIPKPAIVPAVTTDPSTGEICIAKYIDGQWVKEGNWPEIIDGKIIITI